MIELVQQPRPAQEFDRFEVVAEGLGRYVIDVSLPAHVAEGARLPLILATDGNYLFEAARYALHGGLNQYGGLMPPSILVGVGYPLDEGQAAYSARRNFDFYGPWDMQDEMGRLLRAVFEDRKRAEGSSFPEMRAGGYDRFMGFLRDELMPAITARFPVDPAARHTVIGCSSGGHFVQRAIFDPTSPFRRYVCISPSFGIPPGEIEKAEAEYAAAHDDLDADVFICSGRAALNYRPYALVHEASGVLWTVEQFMVRNWRSARIDWEIMDFEDHASSAQRGVTSGLKSVHHVRPGRDDEEIRRLMQAMTPAAFAGEEK
jgi:predicted alpha/beta superfamily hydrolase